MLGTLLSYLFSGKNVKGLFGSSRAGLAFLGNLDYHIFVEAKEEELRDGNKGDQRAGIKSAEKI